MVEIKVYNEVKMNGSVGIGVMVEGCSYEEAKKIAENVRATVIAERNRKSAPTKTTAPVEVDDDDVVEYVTVDDVAKYLRTHCWDEWLEEYGADEAIDDIIEQIEDLLDCYYGCPACLEDEIKEHIGELLFSAVAECNLDVELEDEGEVIDLLYDDMEL